jgi:hypothetical protein
MNWKSRQELITGVVAALLFVVLGPTAWAGSCWDCRKPRLDIPISLAEGTVVTPEFLVKREGYVIKIQVSKKLPFSDLNCMMGLNLPLHKCDKDPLLQVDWILRDHEEVVAQGCVHVADSHGGWSNDSIERYIGGFGGEGKKKYVLELRFTKDGSALNVADPHLIVIMSKPTDS